MKENLLLSPTDTAHVKNKQTKEENILIHISFHFSPEIQLHYNSMGTTRYMPSLIDQNVLMQHMTVFMDKINYMISEYVVV